MKKPLYLCLLGFTIAMRTSSALGQDLFPNSPPKKKGQVIRSGPFKESDLLADRVAELESSAKRCLEMRASLAAEANTVSPRQRILGACNGSFSVESVSKDFANFAPESLQVHILLYYQCMAVASNNYSPCGFLKPDAYAALDKGGTVDKGGAVISIPYAHDESCRMQAASAFLSKALITNSTSSLKKACQDECVMRPAGYRKNDPGNEFCMKTCQVLIDNRNTPGDICAKQSEAIKGMPEFEKSEKLMTCRSPTLYGLPGACSVFSPGHSNWATCMSFGAFRTAYRAQNIKLCGGYPLCHAMMGGGAASCQSYVQGIKTDYCGEYSLKRWPFKARYRPAEAKLAEREAQLPMKLSHLDNTCGKILTEAGAALNSLPETLRSTLPGTPGREQRIKRQTSLRKKFDELMKVFKKSPSGKAPVDKSSRAAH